MERALRDCEERKSQMIMQRMQPVDPCAEFEARYNQGPGSGGSGGSPNNGGTGNQVKNLRISNSCTRMMDCQDLINTVLHFT